MVESGYFTTVHRGRVIGRCEDATGIEPFSRLVEQVMTAQPYASADRVFWITDNGCNAVAGPFNWRFTRTDLNALLTAHEQALHDLAA